MPRKRSIVFWMSAVKSLLMSLLTLALLLVVDPLFVEIFSDWETQLPNATLSLLTLSDFCKSSLLLLIALFLVAKTLFVWVLVELDKRQCNVLIILVSTLPTLPALMILITLLLPILHLPSLTGN